MTKPARYTSIATVLVAAAAVVIAAGTSAPAPDALHAVKRAAAEMHTLATGKEKAKVADFFVQEDAVVLRKVLTCREGFTKRAQTARKLVRARLGRELPPPNIPDFEKAGAIAPMSNVAGTDELTFEPRGEKVIVRDKLGRVDLTFVRQGAAWKAQLHPDNREGYRIVAQLVDTLYKALDTLIGGMHSGAITQENFDAKMERIAREQISPALEKFLKSLQALNSKRWRPAIGQTTTQPATTRAATTRPATGRARRP